MIREKLGRREGRKEPRKNEPRNLLSKGIYRFRKMVMGVRKRGMVLEEWNRFRKGRKGIGRKIIGKEGKWFKKKMT